MKTAEEILESHLTSMLSRTEDSYVTIDEMKQVPEWEACVKAIEQAQKEAHNQALDDCLKHVAVYQDEWFDHRAGEWRFGIPTIDKESILKLRI